MLERNATAGPEEARRKPTPDRPPGRPLEPRSFLDEDREEHIPILARAAAPSAPAPSSAFSLAPAGEKAFAVIPCLNEARHIEALINQLLADSAWDDPLIVVADGGSTDGSREIVRRIASRDPRVRLMHNPKQLQSAGVNLAARSHGAGRRWLVRVDAHAAYPANFVSGLVSEARRVGAASVVVAMHTRGAGGFQSAAATAQNSMLGAGGAPHRMGRRSGWVDHGHHALLELERFLAIGGYDESFSHNEDAEFDVRLAQARGGIWLTRELEVTYYPRETARSLFRQYFHYGRGRARTLLQHRLRPKLRQILLLPVAPAALLAPLGFVEPVAALPAALWSGAALGYGLIVAGRQRRLSDCACGAAAMVMHLAWSSGFWSQLLCQVRPPSPRRGLLVGVARP